MSTQTLQFGVDAESYRENGFAVIPGVFDDATLAQARAESDRLMELCGSDPEFYGPRIEWEVDHLAPEERAGMDRVIRKLEPISDLSPFFAELALEPRLGDPARSVFDDDVHVFEDKLNLKLPGGSPYPWHQDWSCCWRAHTDELATCFVYLDDADEVNGCLSVVPRSHADKTAYPFKVGSHFEIDSTSFDVDSAVALPLKAGDMIMFDSWLLHYSDLNRSNAARRAIIYTYNPARLGKINENRFFPTR